MLVRRRIAGCVGVWVVAMSVVTHRLHINHIHTRMSVVRVGRQPPWSEQARLLGGHEVGYIPLHTVTYRYLLGRHEVGNGLLLGDGEGQQRRLHRGGQHSEDRRRGREQLRLLRRWQGS